MVVVVPLYKLTTSIFKFFDYINHKSVSTTNKMLCIVELKWEKVSLILSFNLFNAGLWVEAFIATFKYPCLTCAETFKDSSIM